MARAIDWDSVPDSTLLPDNLYVLEIESITEGTSKAGHLMYTGTFRVADGEFSGMALFDRFAIGTVDDPTAEEPGTWVKSVGARRLKRLFKSSGVTLGPDVDEMIRVATQQRFVATVVIEVDDGIKDPKYKGTQRNRIVAMYPLADRELAKPPAGVSTAPPPARSVARSTKPVGAPPRAAAPGAASAPKVPTVRCGYCSEMIPRDAYVAHIDEKHAGEEE